MTLSSIMMQRGGGQRLRTLAQLRPATRPELHRFVKHGLGLNVSSHAVSAGSTPPLDYLAHAFFEGQSNSHSPHSMGANNHSTDCVVWANRGGGKTMLGAVATLLDLIFKPGIQVRILGGSLEQSGKMYEHLTALLDRPLLQGKAVAAPPTARRVILTNGSRVELLAGSQKSVRGVRVHKLRCDEVEEFDPAVWEAAQLVTRSGMCGDQHITASVEALSTMHRPHGLMSSLVNQPANPNNNAPANASQGFKVFRWNAMDVVAKCPEHLPCEGCVLWNDCGGLAKSASGFVPVTDLIAQWKRTSRRTWDAEMMCRRPSVAHSVYPNFEPSRHVKHHGDASPDTTWLGGMDFGLRSPHAMLWATLDPSTDGINRLHIMDEYVVADLTLDRHIQAIDARSLAMGWPDAKSLTWVGVDPAGHQRDRHSGISDIALLKRHGYRVRSARSRITQGIELVRRYLDRDQLTIDPRCTQLIRAIESYHFDPDRPADENPIKDGPDHACDALRYLLVNLQRPSQSATFNSYL